MPGSIIGVPHDDGSSRLNKVYLKAVLLGLAAGILLMIVQASAPIPGLDYGIPYVPNLMNISESNVSIRNAGFTRVDIAKLENTAYFLRFCLLFLEQGFAYIFTCVCASLFLTQYRHVRAVNCISKSLKFSVTVLFAIYALCVSVIIVDGLISKFYSIHDVLAVILSSVYVFHFSFLLIGIFLLLGSLTVNMVTWKSQTQENESAERHLPTA